MSEHPASRAIKKQTARKVSLHTGGTWSLTAKLPEQLDCGDHRGGSGGKADAERVDDFVTPVRARETSMFFILILFFHNGFLGSKTGRYYAAGVRDTLPGAPCSNRGRASSDEERYFHKVGDWPSRPNNRVSPR